MSTDGLNEKAVATGEELRLDIIIAALQTRMPAGTKAIYVGTELMPIPRVIALAQAMDKPFKDERALGTELAKLAAAREDNRKAARAFLSEVRAGLNPVFGRTSQELVHFGFKPAAPPRQRTLEEKARAAEKAKLTRQLRGTKGSRQKAELKATDAMLDAPSSEAKPGGMPPASSQRPAA